MYEIQGIGPPDPKLVIVSDFPNKDELEFHYAISGKVGGTLSPLLRAAGISIDDTYRTQVLKIYRDGFNRRNKKDQKTAVKNALEEFPFEKTLKEELRMLEPNAILALGELSLYTLTGLSGLHNYRGSILQPLGHLQLPEKTKVIPTLHPRELWRNWGEKPLVQFDIQRAVAQSKSSKPHNPKSLLWRVKNSNELKLYWDRGRKGKFMVFDIETWRGYITCIGFCTDGYEAVSVPIFDYATITDRVEVWKLLGKILGCDMPKVNQNIKFDLHYLEKWGWRVNNVVGDTSISARCIYSEFNVRLSLLQSIYTEFPYHKDEGHDYSPLLHSKEQLYLYNAKDCISTWQVHEGQKADAIDLKVADFIQDTYWKNNLFQIYRRADGRGIRIDMTQRIKLIAKYEIMLEMQIAAVHEFYGIKINISSPKQVADFVYEFLKCPKIYKKADEDGFRRLDTGKEALEELYINKVKNEDVKKVLKRIIIVRKLEKILQYLNYLVHPDGRMRTSTKLNGTKSGRTSQTSHEDSLLYLDKAGAFKYKAFGGSLQVIPKRAFEAEEFEGELFGSDIPSIFVPSNGYVFIEGDGGAAEARVVAVLSGDFETLEAMDKIDLHSLTATWTTGKPLSQITSYDRETYGKRPRHAGNYDMQSFRLSQMIHKPLHVCEPILERFHEKVPKVRGVFHMLVRQFVDSTGKLVSPQGRVRQFFGTRDSSLYKEAYSVIPQATVSDHVKCTMPLLLEDVADAEMLLEKHDSLLIEVPEVEREYACERLKEHLERPISFRKGSFIRDFDLVIPADVKWSDENWLNMKKVIYD